MSHPFDGLFQTASVARECVMYRESVIHKVSKVRYPQDKHKVITRKTLWRWCSIAGIPSRLKAYTFDQVALLVSIASHLEQGYGYDWIETNLGKYNDDSRTTKATPRKDFRFSNLVS